MGPAERPGSSSTGFLRPQALEKAATISRREAGSQAGVVWWSQCWCRQGCGLLENVFEAYCTPGQSVAWHKLAGLLVSSWGKRPQNQWIPTKTTFCLSTQITLFSKLVGSPTLHVVTGNRKCRQLLSSGDGRQMLCEVDER